MENIYTEYYNFGYYDGANPNPGNYPILSYEDIVYLSNLVQFGADLNGCVFYLENDLDLTGINHTPIGTGLRFEGIFDGCGYTIRNFTVDETTSSLYGFFGYIGENGIVKNLNFDNANLTQRIKGGRMGAIAGENYGLIEKCSVTNSTVASLKTGIIGALVGGSNENGRINYSYAASVNIDGAYASGITRSGYITNCFTFDIQDAGTYPVTNFYYISGSYSTTNSYYYSDCATPENFSGATESSINDFTSGKICMLINNSFYSSGLDIFGQEIGVDDYPVFLTPSNSSTKLAIPVHFETNGEIFATEVANENTSLLSLPTPYNKEERTCNYSLNEVPFSLSNVITEEVTVSVSGGINKPFSEYFFNNATGTGTAGDPFLISTKEDFELFRLACDAEETISSGESYGILGYNSHVELSNDIVLNSMTNNALGNVMVYDYSGDTYFFEPNSGFWYLSTDLENEVTNPSLLTSLSSLIYTWNPFDVFRGTLNGNGFEIEGIYINNTGTSYSGLFSNLEGTVYDLSVSGYIKVSSYAGGIAGSLQANGSIINCTNRATIVTLNSFSGGIVGQLFEGLIDSCVNYGAVSNSGYAGGISGSINNSYNQPSIIINCINYGNIASSGFYAGGIIGRADGNYAQIINNINYGLITASTGAAGGILGYATDFDSLNLSNNINFNTVNSAQHEGGIVGAIANGSSSSSFNYWLAGCCDNEDGYGYVQGSYIWENNSNFSDIEGILTVSSLIDVNGDSVDSTVLLTLVNEFSTMYPGCKSWEQLPNLTFIYYTGSYFTITYDPNYDSTYRDTITYSPFQSSISDPGFQRDGYSFLGWSLVQSDTIADETYAPGELCFLTENITLYAIWENDYEVKYMSTLGGIDKEYTQYIHTNETEFDVLGLDETNLWPTSEIFYFVGWNTDPEATDADTTYADGSAPISGNLVLYAVWDYSPVDTLSGSGSEADPFIISSLNDLETLAIWTNDGYYFEGCYFKQTADIVMNNFVLEDGVLYVVYEYEETTYYFDYHNFSFYSPSDLVNPLSLDPSVQEAILSLTYFWNPIGVEEVGYFRANYDGNGHSIIGLIPDPNYNYSGLFGFTAQATISNLRIKYGRFEIKEIGGAIAANTHSTKIINCSVEDVYFYETEESDHYAGGLVGILQDESSIINSYVIATITFNDTGWDNCFGGLVYDLSYDSSIYNSYSNITPIDENLSDYNYFAHIAVYLDDSRSNDEITPLISNCYYFVGDPESPSGFLPAFLDDQFNFDYNRVSNVFFYDIHIEDPIFPENPPESGYWVIELLGKDEIIFTDLLEVLNSFSESYEGASNWFLYRAPERTPSLENFFTLTFKNSFGEETTGLISGSSETISIEKRNATGDIYYTLDGSEPTIALGTLYTEPLVVSNGTILKAVEYFDGSYGVVSTIVFSRAISISYNISSAISGETPIDTDNYAIGDIVNLERGYDLVGPSETPVFSGWALSPSSTEGTYTLLIKDPSEGFVITLYPVWKSMLDSPIAWDGVTFDTGWYFDDPNAKVFNISTAAEFAGIPYLVDLLNITEFENQTINLLSDIDLGSHEWPSIGWYGTFSGTLNGNFHTIYNLYISENNHWYEQADFTGLFSYVYYGSIKNLGLSGGYVYGDSYAAPLANSIDSSSILNCWVEGIEVEVPFEEGIVGGIVGTANNYSTISNCYSFADLLVGSFGYAGGIVGETYSNDESHFSNCYFAGSIEHGVASYIGSIFGNYISDYISIVPVASSLYYEENTYPLIGYSSILPSSILSSSPFAYELDSFTLSQEVDPNMDSVTTASLLFALNEGAEVSYYPWNNPLWVEDSFGIIRLNTLVYAKETPDFWTDEDIIDLDWYYSNLGNDSYYISTPAELGGLAYIVNTLEDNFSEKTVFLLKNLDMSGAIWIPIGNNYNESLIFSGTFDGMGHTISNIHTPSEIYEYTSGFFGMVVGTILNLGIIDSSSFANSIAGGIVGILHGNIYNCFYTGTVFGRTYSGGLVGRFIGSSEGGIQNSWTTAEVSGLPGCIAGALVGYANVWEEDKIRFCYWVDNDEITPIGEKPSSPAYSFCLPVSFVDGEFILLSVPVDYDEDSIESTTLVQVLNEVVRIFGTNEYAKHSLSLTGYPTFDGYYYSYDVLTAFSHTYVEYGDAGRNVATEGYDYVIGLAASTGYTLNGALPSVFVGGVQIESSCYSWDTSSSILTIYSQYITDHITISFEALPALISISKAPTLNGSFEVNENALFRSTVEISVMPDEGYEISAVNYQEQSGALLTANYNIITGKYEFVMPGRATTVAVTFSPIVYTISLFDEGGIASHGYYETDKSVATITDVIQVRPHPDSGYEVDSVTYIINSIEKNALIDEGYWIEDITGDVVVKVTFKVKHYNVVLDSTYTGGGEFYASSSIAASGATVYVSLSPDPGYEALNENIYYSYGGHNYSMTLYSGYYYRSFTMPASDVTVYVIFTEVDYSITKQATSNGSYTVVNGDDQEIEVANYSEIIYVVPTPNAGYEVDSVRYNTTGYVDVPYDLEYSISMPNYPVQIYVTFKKVVYDITANATTNGSYTLSKTSAYYGDTITVTPIPAPGYEIDSVSYNDGSSHDITPVLDVYSFDMPASDISISVSFYPITPVITATESDNGSFTITNSTSDPVTSMPYTELVIITPTPDSGYQVDKVYYYANSVGIIYIPNISGYSFEMPAFDITVYVTFISTSANIIVNTPTGGWLKVTSDPSGANIIDTAAPSATVYITYYLNPGYSFAEVIGLSVINESLEEVDLSLSSGYTYYFYMPTTGGVTITLTTVLGSKSISYFDVDGYAEHGSYSALSETVNVGSAVEISATPEDGYYISSISYSYNDGTDTVYLPSLGFIMPNSDVTLKVTFAPITYYVTKGTSNNGTFDVTPSSTTVGEEITVYNFVPDKGYEVNSVSYNDGVDDYGVYPVLGSYYFDMPAADVVVTVVFTKIDYSISKEPTSNGSFLTTDGSIEIYQANYMDEVIIILDPNTGYELDVMYYEDEASNRTYVTYNSGYRFDMPANNVVFHVIYKKTNYYITKTPTEGGTIVVSDSDLVSEYNAGITLTVTPLTGFKIDHVYYTNKTNSIQTEIYLDTPGNYIFSMPDANVSVEATFSRVQYGITATTVGLGNYEMWDGNGLIESGLATFGYNTYVVLEDSFAPAAGYKFLSVEIIKDSDLSVISYTYTHDTELGLGKYQFLMPNSAITVTVTFVEENYLVSFEALSNGNAKIYRDGQAEVTYLDDVKYNEQIAIKVYPNIGYEIASVTAFYDSAPNLLSDPESDGVYLLSMPAENVVLSVTFSAIDYTVTSEISGTGTLLLNGSVSLSDANVGDKITLTITPGDYYELSEISYTYGATTKTITPVEGVYSFNMPASDVEIAISFTKIIYTITYQSLEVTPPEAVTYDCETDLVLAAGISRPGYIFSGWKITTASGSWMINTIYGASDNLPTTMNGNVTLTAQWDAVLYELQINGQTITYSRDESITIPSAITAPFGYAFAGWEVFGLPTGNWVSGEIALADSVYPIGEKYGDASLRPKNTALSYVMTFDVQGGIYIEDLTYYSSVVQKLHGEASKTGYTFTGWKVTANDGNWVIGELYPANYQFEAVGIYGNVTLQAQWSIITYTINIYEDNDSANVLLDTLQYTIETGFTLSTGTPRNGYFLAHYEVTWSQANWASVYGEYEPGFFEAGNYGNANVKERWEKTLYTISFDTDGGSTIDPTNYYIGVIISIVANPEKEGFTLTGWKVTTPGGSWNLNYVYPTVISYPNNHEIYGDVTLTAVWEISEYSIDYSGAANTGVFLHNQTVSFATKASSPGHTFLYWEVISSDPESNWVIGERYNSGDSTSGKYGDVVLTEVWETPTISITYVTGNNASVLVPGTPSVVYGQSISALPLVSHTLRPGYSYNLIGWFDAEVDGNLITGETLINESNLAILSDARTTISLYSRFTETLNTYSIQYYNVGTSSNSNPASYTVESEKIDLVAISKIGYTFDGWYDNDTFTGSAVLSIEASSTGNKMLYAKFNAIEYTIIYLSNGGTNINSELYTIEDALTLSIPPIRPGYSFEGWVSGATTEGNWESEHTFNGAEALNAGKYGNITLEAQWEKIIITLNDSTVSGDNVTFNPDGTVSLPNPEKDGFTFDGWYLDAECTQFFNPETDTITSGMTLYPKWNIVAAGGRTPGLSGGAIAGIVVGSVGFVAIVLTLLYFFVLKKKGFDIKNLLQKKPKRIDNLTPQKPEEPKTTESDGDNTPKE